MTSLILLTGTSGQNQVIGMRRHIAQQSIEY